MITRWWWWISLMMVAWTGCAPPAARDVAGRWELTVLEGVNGPLGSSQEPVHMILDLQAETIRGYGGVNRFRGSLQGTRERLEVGPIMSTKMAGPLMDVEIRFLEVLQSRPVLQREGQRLRLLDEGGRCLAEFKAAE